MKKIHFFILLITFFLLFGQGSSAETVCDYSCYGDCIGVGGSTEDCIYNCCYTTCTPNCSGRECGGDGCGGSCGSCGSGYTCSGGQCVAANCSQTNTNCGDPGYCENCTSKNGCSGGLYHTYTCTPDNWGGYYCADTTSCKDSCCPSGQVCKSGSCAAKPCSDTDNGYNINLRGTCTDQTGSVTDSCAGSTLTEYQCNEGYCEAVYVDCGSDTCKNGICVAGGELGVPGVSYPANGATGISTTIFLSWTTASGANSYKWDIYNGATKVNSGITNGSNSTQSPQITLNPSTQYTWHVTACRDSNGVDCNTNKLTASFTTGSKKNRGEACANDSECSSNSCSSFSGACYDAGLSNAGNESCYDKLECSSNLCQSPALPEIPGYCKGSGACDYDNTIDTGEECDGTALKGKTCSDFGKSGNGLKCVDCNFNTDDCTGGDTTPVDTNISLKPPWTIPTFEALIDKVINFIFILGIVLAPLFYILAGFNILTAAGDPHKVQTAKNIALYTTIGLGIILFARGLIAVLKSVIGA